MKIAKMSAAQILSSATQGNKTKFSFSGLKRLFGIKPSVRSAVANNNEKTIVGRASYGPETKEYNSKTGTLSMFRENHATQKVEVRTFTIDKEGRRLNAAYKAGVDYDFRMDEKNKSVRLLYRFTNPDGSTEDKMVGRSQSVGDKVFMTFYEVPGENRGEKPVIYDAKN